MPTVSIIVPIYNVETYLPECVDSVLKQGFTDYELIVVDDGSPDRCGAICDQYALKDDSIRVVHKTNGGLSDARNAGLDIAQGKYVFFLDSDDKIVPDLLETVVPYMEQGYELTAFTLKGFYDDGMVQLPWKRKTGSFFMNTPEERRDFIHREIVQATIGWEAWSRMFVRDIIERHQLRFADNRKIFAEDMCFSLCYCAHIRKAISLDACLYYYRQRRDSIMGTYTGKNNLDRIEYLAEAVQSHYSRCEDCSLLVQSFPLLHVQILMSQFIFQIQYAADPEKHREEVISSLRNWPQTRKMIHTVQSDKTDIRKYYSSLGRFELNRNMDFLMGGSVAMLKLSRWTVQKIRNQRERLDRILSR